MGKTIARLLTGILFILAGINHFRSPGMYRAIMPPYLPWHEPLVALSGAAELGLGALALIPLWRRQAGWGLIALLVAVFPANLHMALHSDRYPQIPAWLLWCRLPLQVVLIAGVRWCTAPED
ncbi:MAG: MauE/DoxX family redox-associated membrane protein [Roseiflexaceae bacterium]